MAPEPREIPPQLEAARRELLDAWAALGPAWGVSPTMSQVHAFCMVAEGNLNTDDIMAGLSISRGNAHKSIKELVGWGLLRPTRVPGDRKEYFVCEKDVWKVIQIITRERKRKELEPVLEALERCMETTKGLRDSQTKAFRRQLADLQEFAQLADSVMEKVGSKRSGTIVSWAMRLLK
ncbi:MAG: transcriptional regulator [Planctomycetota bacterium]|nr:transcriptional regulator [Planctomycetota bacterium]